MDYKDLSDEEIIDLVTEYLSEDDRIRTEFIKVDCEQGRLILTGQVRSDEELQAIGEVLNDVLDIQDYENHIWVDDTLVFKITDADGDLESPSFKGDDGDDEEEDSHLDAEASFEPGDDDEEEE